jgi:hypothetical protein
LLTTTFTPDMTGLLVSRTVPGDLSRGRLGQRHCTHEHEDREHDAAYLTIRLRAIVHSSFD